MNATEARGPTKSAKSSSQRVTEHFSAVKGFECEGGSCTAERERTSMKRSVDDGEVMRA